MNELITKKRQTPEDHELTNKKVELEHLEATLAQRELDLITFEVELGRFEQLYLKIVGRLYAELDEIEAKIAEAEVASYPNDENARKTATESRAQAEESAYTTESVKGSKPYEKFKPSDSMKKLYRELARLLHPDLVVDEDEKAKRHDLMAKANKAYESGDEAVLAQMLEDRRSSPDTVKGDGVGAELIRIIRRISQAEERLREIDKEFASLEQSELFELKSQVDEAELEGRDLLTEMSEQIGEKISAAREKLGDEVPTRVRNDKGE